MQYVVEMMHRYFRYLVIAGLLLLFSCGQQPRHSTKRIELLTYKSIITNYGFGVPIVVDGDTVIQREDFWDVTYICVDSGLVVFRTRTLSDTVNDTVFYFSPNYVASHAFSVPDSIVYRDSLHWSGDLDKKGMYLTKGRDDSCRLVLDTNAISGHMFTLINAMGHNHYDPQMEQAKKNVLLRIRQIRNAALKYTIFPAIKFCPPGY